MVSFSLDLLFLHSIVFFFCFKIDTQPIYLLNGKIFSNMIDIRGEDLENLIKPIKVSNLLAPFIAVEGRSKGKRSIGLIL